MGGPAARCQEAPARAPDAGAQGFFLRWPGGHGCAILPARFPSIVRERHMQTLLQSLLALALAYLIGSISPAWFAGRARGLDLRFEGDETLDGENAWQVLGRGPGALVFLADLLKGQVAVGLAYLLGASPLALVLAGLGVTAGQIWPLFHGWAGGRGLAPAAGVLLAASPWTFVLSATLFALLASLAGRLAHAALFAIALMPGAALVAGRGDAPLMLLAIGLAAMLVWARRGLVEVLLGVRKADEEEK
jgi:glycerol-3-phosphate acyltransferase PlsY